MGETPTRSGNRIRLDQGLDTTEISPARALDPLLLETQYAIEIDNRLGSIVEQTDGVKASVSFVDDDSIATYYLSKGHRQRVCNGYSGHQRKQLLLVLLRVREERSLSSRFNLHLS